MYTVITPGGNSTVDSQTIVAALGYTPANAADIVTVDGQVITDALGYTPANAADIADPVTLTDSEIDGILGYVPATPIQGGKADTALQPGDASTTGGANKLPKIDSDGTFRTMPINPTTGINPGNPIRISAQQRIVFEKNDGSDGSEIWMFPNHGSSHDALPYPELIFISPRHCYYWDDGFQIGNSQGGPGERGWRYVYYNPLGRSCPEGTQGFSDPTLDTVMESIAIQYVGGWWNGSQDIRSAASMQYVPNGVASGEWGFWIGPDNGPGGTSARGRIMESGGHTRVMSLVPSGIKLPSGRRLTFGDGTYMDSAPVSTARTGKFTLSAGTASVEDSSITLFSNVILSRRVLGGTPGTVGYELTDGVGFAVTSSSSADTSSFAYFIVEDVVALGSPTIAGGTSPKPLVGETLTVMSGGGDMAYQWCADGTPISGQTSSTYTVTPSVIGKTITCTEDGLSSNSVTVWHPSDEGTLVGFFDAHTGVINAASASASNGDSVSQWSDISGNMNHVYQLTSDYQPVYDTSGAKPNINFDGVNDRLFRALSVTLPQTVIMVVMPKSTFTNAKLFTTDEAYDRLLVQELGDTSPAYVTNYDNPPVSSNGFTYGALHVVSARATSTVRSICLDHETEAVTSDTGVGAGLGLYVSGAAANCSDTRFYELLFYHADLSDAARGRLTDYLFAKWFV